MELYDLFNSDLGQGIILTRGKEWTLGVISNCQLPLVVYPSCNVTFPGATGTSGARATWTGTFFDPKNIRFSPNGDRDCTTELRLLIIAIKIYEVIITPSTLCHFKVLPSQKHKKPTVDPLPGPFFGGVARAHLARSPTFGFEGCSLVDGDRCWRKFGNVRDCFRNAMDFCLDFTRSNFSDMPKLCILGLLAQMGFPAGFGSGDKSI